MHKLSLSPGNIFLLALFFCSGLFKPSAGNAQLPTVTTASVTNISIKDATSGGSVISQGSSAVTARGVCWSSTNKVPTVEDNVIMSGSGIGTFKSVITGLNLSTFYYVRAFAINGSGKGYGAVVTFKTSNPPEVITSSVTDITVNDAIAGGNVLYDGGPSILSRGVCWSTSSNPTIDLPTKTNDGNTLGVFSSKITGLLADIRYYVRAYVVNTAGVIQYGAEMSFVTKPMITIGTQVWSKTNLNVARYRNGDIIPEVKDRSQWANLTTGAWCWYNNDSATNAANYGRLYNWYAVNDSRGLCPAGWHVPSDSEWTTLTTYLGGNYVAGGKMKLKGSVFFSGSRDLARWNNPNAGANNLSDFSGLPGGARNANGAFGFNDVLASATIGNSGYWWSSTADNVTNYVWCRRLIYISDEVFRDRFINKAYGYSVRCVKD